MARKPARVSARPLLRGSALWRPADIFHSAGKSLILVALTRKERLLIETGKQRGYTFSHPDVLIAASAAHHGLTVVTRNVREFVEAGVAVINPWEDPGTNP